jgi:ligand-binding SRPBCC domain-containing protein
MRKSAFMSYFQVKRVQALPITLTEAWDFFSWPANLDEITPPGINMAMLNEPGEKIFAGQIITYRIKPFLGIPIFWMTEITHIKDRHYFVDEQRFGPFAIWHHLHSLRK